MPASGTWCLPIHALPVPPGSFHVAVRLSSSSATVPHESRPAYTFRTGAGPSSRMQEVKAVVFDVRTPHPSPAVSSLSHHFETHTFWSTSFLTSSICELRTCAPCLGKKTGFTQIGGVVCRSPLIAIAAYEREHSIPDNYINCSMSVLPGQPPSCPTHCCSSVFHSRDGGKTDPASSFSGLPVD